MMLSLLLFTTKNDFFPYSCFESNLNGEYHENPLDNDYYRGIIWELWRGDYSLKSSKMMIRSRAFQSTWKNKKGALPNFRIWINNILIIFSILYSSIHTGAFFCDLQCNKVKLNFTNIKFFKAKKYIYHRFPP